jgi:CheY-like chemotaxis protein
VKARVLVVDDSPTVRSTIEWLLCDQGYAVAVAQDGLEALAMLQDYRPELVLLDIFLPFVDGIQICQFIRQQSDMAALPVIIISGQARKPDVEKAVAAGANGYLLKPVQDADLLAALERHLPQLPFQQVEAAGGSA